MKIELQPFLSEVCSVTGKALQAKGKVCSETCRVEGARVFIRGT